jgi:hypothetical protein
MYNINKKIFSTIRLLENFLFVNLPKARILTLVVLNQNFLYFIEDQTDYISNKL